ncbi:MAG TPA: SMP-30/gluconolactonase/LRE family protein [Actinomycetota bacterium]|nr:SMP-30/gluconolactonase/LRE family protein [Actinomycetota bacterium]
MKEPDVPEPRTLLTDLILGESPRWHDDRLWFSDWGAREVLAVDLEGTRDVIVRVPSFPFSIDWLPKGQLLIVSASDRQLLRRESDGSLVTHADLGSLSDFPWNEIVVDGRGNTYLNNIGFDMMAGEPAGPGIVALVTPDGSTRQVADGVLFPNGMAVTPDNSTLVLAESHGQRLTAFHIEADGGLSNRRVWADLDGYPDGICLDAEGAVWFGDVANTRCVRVREGGEVLQTIELDRGCFACMLGGPDGKTLFMMAAEWPAAMSDAARTGQVLTLDAPAPGAGWP